MLEFTTIPYPLRHKAICHVKGNTYPGLIAAYDVPCNGTRLIFYPVVGTVDTTKNTRIEKIHISPDFAIYSEIIGSYENPNSILPELIMIVKPVALDAEEIAEKIIHEAISGRLKDEDSSGTNSGLNSKNSSNGDSLSQFH